MLPIIQFIILSNTHLRGYIYSLWKSDFSWSSFKHLTSSFFYSSLMTSHIAFCPLPVAMTIPCLKECFWLLVTSWVSCPSKLLVLFHSSVSIAFCCAICFSASSNGFMSCINQKVIIWIRSGASEILFASIFVGKYFREQITVIAVSQNGWCLIPSQFFAIGYVASFVTNLEKLMELWVARNPQCAHVMRQSSSLSSSSLS